MSAMATIQEEALPRLGVYMSCALEGIALHRLLSVVSQKKATLYAAHYILHSTCS